MSLQLLSVLRLKDWGERSNFINCATVIPLTFQTNVLTELRKWKLSLIEHHKLQMRQEKEKHASHVRQLSNEMANLKELLRTYEISIGRKDEVVIQFHNSVVPLFLKIH